MLVCGLVTLVLLGGVVAPLPAGAVNPKLWTTTANTISRDSFGNPVQASFTISGPSTTYAICLKMTASPPYNTKAATYDTYKYGSYAPCKKFSLSVSGGKDTQGFGTNFTFGGPGTYEVDWYVPDLPANGGTQVGTAGTLRWKDTAGKWSPCPPDPQLQIGVWRPSRHQILNRCKTMMGKVTRAVSTSSDYDRNWSFSTLRSEYVMRDLKFLPSPALNSTWTITGVFVCDTYHGWKELHPVFQATNSSGRTWLSGPQYSTATPSITGTWSLVSCP